MEIVIITGMSGSGKSVALHEMEDLGYYCLDNIPPALVPSFLEIAKNSGSVTKIALVMDARTAGGFQGFVTSVLSLMKEHPEMKLVFLDAHDSVLVKRFKETRRKHPFFEKCNGQLLSAIAYERELFTPLREAAKWIIDTTSYSVRELKNHLEDLHGGGKGVDLAVNISSFGFKHGLPTDADLVFDVRCFKNPHYVKSLRNLTGIDPLVSEFVFSDPSAKHFTEMLIDMLTYMIPCYASEGRAQLEVAIGCTGGHHRSVAIAERVAAHINDHVIHCSVRHRDIKI